MSLMSNPLTMFRAVARTTMMAAIVTLLALPFVTFSNASANCVLGCRSCQGGFEYTCEKCGSETCWILSGGRCDYNGSRCMMKQNPNAQGFPVFSDILTATPVNWNPAQAFSFQKN